MKDKKKKFTYERTHVINYTQRSALVNNKIIISIFNWLITIVNSNYYSISKETEFFFVAKVRRQTPIRMLVN